MLKLIDLAIDLFVIWLLYKLVTEFVIPLFQISREWQKRFKSAQEQSSSNTSFRTSSSSAQHRVEEGEYIEFEEIKNDVSSRS
ncbi:MAG: hypothetical protein K6T34_02165 [Thermoflavifilum sp.]|nr:hypothetical protein [Thermoflavifilum sp.]